MSVRHATCLFLVVALSSSGAAGQDVAAEPASFAPVDLGSGIHVLRNPTRNIVAWIGKDDAVLFDNHYDTLNDEILAAVRSKIEPPVRFIVKTLPGASTDEPLATTRSLLVTHNNSQTQMDPTQFAELVGRRNQSPLNEPAVVTLEDGDTVELNGISIAARRPDLGEIGTDPEIFFPEANVVYMRDLLLSSKLPLVDLAGGSFVALIHNMWAVALETDSATKIIPGRGPVIDHATLLAIADALERVSTRIDNRLQQGHRRDEIVTDTPRLFSGLTAAGELPANIGSPTPSYMTIDTETIPWLSTQGWTSQEFAYANGITRSRFSSRDYDVSMESKVPAYRTVCHETGYTTDAQIFEDIVKSYCRDRVEAIKIIAVGDSWFSYTYSLPSLRTNPDNPFLGLLLDTSRHGAQVLTLLSETERDEDKEAQKKLNELLETIHSTKPDVLLVSYGGNDLLAEATLNEILSADSSTGEGAEHLRHINEPVLKSKINLIESALVYLFRLVAARSPDTQIFMHTYDKVKPEDRKIPAAYGVLPAFFGPGPWIWSVLDDKKIPDKHHSKIADHLLEELQEGIKRSTESENNAHVVLTHKTLTPGNHHEWADEIHPTTYGFCKVALKLVGAMQKSLPNRVFLKIQQPSENNCKQFGPNPEDPR